MSTMPCEVTLMLLHCIRNQSCGDGSWLVDLRSTSCGNITREVVLLHLNARWHADITVPVTGKSLTGRCAVCLPMLSYCVVVSSPACVCTCIEAVLEIRPIVWPRPSCWMTTVAVNAALCPRIPPSRHTVSTMHTVLHNVHCFVFHLCLSMQM